MKNIITLFSFILIITSCDVVEGPYLIDDGGITTEEEMRKFRGNDIAMIFQEPMTSLNRRLFFFKYFGLF
ncbi:MAG: hypothetical protein HN535_04415, partial [Flavobacteriales bacterium]|nr:hypothetical protein [Flavobacteriales bacterium]